MSTELATDLPAVAGNRGKLQQVLVNLALNSRDALQDKRTRSAQDHDHRQERAQVRIVTARTAKGVELRVEDNGSGMSKETLRKIYDPFFTTKSNPGEGQHKGTGLGLAVTYGIVQEHSGTIEVSSSLDAGTTFRLELPASDSDPSGPGRELSDSASASTQGKVVHV